MTTRGALRDLVGLREFRAMWIGSTASTAGDQLAAVALSLLVFERTQSAAWTALTWSLTLFPPLISGPLLGWVADRFPRRTVMVTTAWSQAVLMAAMAIPGMPLWAMIVLLVAVLAISSPYLAAQEASLPKCRGVKSGWRSVNSSKPHRSTCGSPPILWALELGSARGTADRERHEQVAAVA